MCPEQNTLEVCQNIIQFDEGLSICVDLPSCQYSNYN